MTAIAISANLTKRAALVLLLTICGTMSAWAERCALIDVATVTVLKVETFAGDCPPDPTGKGWAWVPAPPAVQPVYDSATQRLVGPTRTVTLDGVTETYTVENKTPAEIAAEDDARREGILSDIGELVLKRLCDHESRIRVLEAKSALTWEQCRQQIKAAITP